MHAKADVTTRLWAVLGKNSVSDITQGGDQRGEWDAGFEVAHLRRSGVGESRASDGALGQGVTLEKRAWGTRLACFKVVDWVAMADTVQPGVTERRRNTALWYGLLITLLGMATELFYFLRLPPGINRLLPWVNLLVPGIGLLYLVLGLARAFGQAAVYRGKIWGSVVTVMALVLFVGNVVLFRHTRDVPKSAGAPQVGQHLGEFTLPDSSGQATTLGQLLTASAGGAQPKAVLLVFYRGYW